MAMARTGLSYVLAVNIAKEVLKVWRQWRNGTVPTVSQMCEAVIHYANNDAFLPPPRRPTPHHHDRRARCR